MGAGVKGRLTGRVVGHVAGVGVGGAKQDEGGYGGEWYWFHVCSCTILNSGNSLDEVP